MNRKKIVKDLQEMASKKVSPQDLGNIVKGLNPAVVFYYMETKEPTV